MKRKTYRRWHARDTHLRKQVQPRRHYLFSRAKWDDLNSDLKPLSEKIVNVDQGGADVNTM